MHATSCKRQQSHKRYQYQTTKPHCHASQRTAPSEKRAGKTNCLTVVQVHYLSGPVSISTAEPGDLLKVEFLNLGTLDGSEWGYTGTFDKENGGGFLTDRYPRASKAIWSLEGIYCSSRHIPGVRFAGRVAYNLRVLVLVPLLLLAAVAVLLPLLLQLYFAMFRLILLPLLLV